MVALSHVRMAAVVAGVSAAVAGLGPAAAAGAASGAVPLSQCVNPDHGNPVIDALEVSRARVEVSRRAQSVTVRVHAHDTGGPGAASGLAHVDVDLLQQVSKFFEPIRSVRLRYAGGDLWEGTLRLARWTEPDRYQVSASAVDFAGEQGQWDTGFGTPHAALPLQVVQSRPDRRAPVLTRFTLTPTRINSHSRVRRVSVAAAATDRGSGVRSLQVNLARRAGSGFVGVALHRARGHRWTGRLTLPRSSPPGRWIPSVSVDDRAGNVRSYRPGQPRAVPSAVHLPAVRVRGTADRAAPTVAGVSTSAATVDLRTSGATVAVDVHLRDDGSGVRTSRLRLSTDSGGAVDLPLRRVAGTPVDGTWRAVWSLTPCGTPAGVWAIGVDLADALGHTVSRELAATVVVQNVDRIRPAASAVEATVTSVPVTFTEDVVGVSTVSAVLERVTGLFAFTSTPVPGRWACASASGAPVDCAAGPVRTATFSPDAPLVRDGSDFYRVTLNPEHVLDLTDLAGNPAAVPVGVSFVAA
jgi:hypothetical protein